MGEKIYNYNPLGNKRRSERVATSVDILCKNSIEQSSGKVEDLSLRGARYLSVSPPHAGKQINCKLLLNIESNLKVTIPVSGEIVWSRPVTFRVSGTARRFYRSGIKFNHIELENLAVLGHFVSNLKEDSKIYM